MCCVNALKKTKVPWKILIGRMACPVDISQTFAIHPLILLAL
jgi:hypothetical protein